MYGTLMNLSTLCDSMLNKQVENVMQYMFWDAYRPWLEFTHIHISWHLFYCDNYCKFPVWSEPRELEGCLHHGGHCAPYRCDVLCSFRFGRTSALGRANYRGQESLEPSRRSFPRRRAKDWGMWRIRLCDIEDSSCK